MTKEVSIMLKGVAILLMLFLYLFNNLDCAMGCQNLLMIDGVPLTHTIVVSYVSAIIIDKINLIFQKVIFK